MPELQTIYSFLNELRLHTGAMWSDNGSLRFSAPKEYQSQETDNFIIAHKPQLLSLLHKNGIFSKQHFFSKTILTDDSASAYPLSPAQERLWFIEQYEEGTNAYHISEVYELGVDANQEGIKYALQQIVSRHEVLRSTIEQNTDLDHGVQVVHHEPLLIEELSLQTGDDVHVFLKIACNRPFDLSRQYPIRVTLYHIPSSAGSDAKTLLLITMHHIASDGWSMNLFEKELSAFYEACIHGDTGFKLPALEIQYKDYASWQRAYLSGDTLKKQLNYWKEKLSGYQTLEFPTDYARPARIDYRGAHQDFNISRETIRKLRALAQDCGVTLNSVMLSSLSILLHKYTGQNDIIVGSATANRHYRQTEDLIGFFVNTQANRTLLSPGQNFRELLLQTHKQQIEAQLYQDLPFEKLVDELGVERDPSRHPVFQVMFTLDSFGGDGKARNVGDYLKPYAFTTKEEIEKFDLSVYVEDQADELRGDISYATSLFNTESMARFTRHYMKLLGQLAETPEKNYMEISLLDAGEYRQIVHDWNTPEKAYPKDKIIHRLIEEQAERIPQDIALVFEDQILSYGELNEKSNQLARGIRKEYQQRTHQELRPDTLIVLCLDRSLEMVISILAVLKAGGAYVPIDPAYPQERIHWMLEDTDTAMILSLRSQEESLRSKLPAEKIMYIDLDEEWYQWEDKSNLPLISQPQDLAYIIYTSGTTGKPKGVMVEHRQLTAFVSHNHFINNETVTTIAGISNYAFDGSVFDIFFSLANGKKLVLIPKDTVLDLVRLDQTLIESKVDTAFVTTALFNALVNNRSKSLHHFRQILMGGERCNIHIANDFKKEYKASCLTHVYGPTENIVFSTFCNLSTYDTTFLAPIGKRLNDKQLYILDSQLQPVPVGVAGELYIGGAGLSRGYLNRPELTAERFISNPFANEADKAKGYTRLYKTGDLVKWLPDGNIDYLGRNDDQVKIRGFRIELGEIEQALLQVPGIQQACVLARERKTDAGNSKYLVGYYVLENPEKNIAESFILESISKSLPDYMLPGTLVVMPSFPLTINGKLDKRALPDPSFAAPTNAYVAPVNELETALCNIWQTVLGLDKVSTADNFFRIGGDSILSIQVASRLRQAGFACQIKDIFEYKTIVRLAEYLGRKSKQVAIKIEQGTLSGELDFLPIQQWFTEQVDRGEMANPNHFNQSFLVRVPELDMDKMKRAVIDLVAYHDALRIRYSKQQEKSSGKMVWTQSYQSNLDMPEVRQLHISQCSEKEIEQTLTVWQSDFNLQQGPLFRIGYLHGYEDGTARLYVAIHHLVVDSVSWRIIVEDLKKLYEGKALPPKGSSYRQWVEQVKSYPAQHPTEAAYWEAQLREISGYSSQDQESAVRSFELDKMLTRSLLQEASKAYHTEVNDLLLTALAYALKELNHQNVQGITLEGHGREEIDPSIDHSRTVGWFTTMFPVKLELQNTIKESIRFIKEALRHIPNKGLGFGAFATSHETAYSFDNLAPISFNYLGQFDNHQDAWQITSEESGDSVSADNKDHNLINIVGMVSDGYLKFSIATKSGEAAAETLSNSFKRHLTQITEHCLKQIRDEGSSYTPSDFKVVNISQSLLDNLETLSKINEDKLEQIYPTTSLQKGFIYHALSLPDDDAYRIQVLFDYKHNLNPDHYRRAWECCLAQYPILRTAFNWEEEIIQLVYKYAKLDYKVHDISHLSTQLEKDNAIKRIHEEDRQQGFDLTKPGLLRIHFIKQAEAHVTVLKNIHHSIADGWSEPILLNSLHRYYHEISQGNTPLVKEDTAYLKTQDYISAHRNSVQDYWKALLAEAPEANDINPLLDKPIDARNYKQVKESATCYWTMEEKLYQHLKHFSQKEAITTNVVMQFVWHKFLQVYSNSPQTIVGTTLSGRDLPVDGIEESVGLYINTLPLIVNWEQDNSVRSQLHHIQQRITEINTHSFVELAKLQKDGKRIFHSLFVFENYPSADDNEDLLDVSIREVIEKGNYALGVTVFEENDTLTLKLDYDTTYLTQVKAEKHLSALEQILQQLIADPEKKHREISLLTPEEYQQIVFEWNGTEKDYDTHQTLVDLFEEQVIRQPDAIALVDEGKSISYRQLHEQSEALAWHLKETYHIVADDLIGIMLDRSNKMIASMLGILKSGAAYVCIDPEHPSARKEFMIKDTAIKVLITQTDYLFDLEFYSGSLFAIDVELETLPAPDPSFEKKIRPQDLAYVIYTSGTTGTPKGVMVEHRSAVNYIHNLEEVFLPEIRNVDFSTNMAFDLTVTTTIGALLMGKKIVVYRGQLSNTELYVRHLMDHHIDFIKGTPSLLANLNPLHFADFKIKQAFIGGEKLDPIQLNHIAKYVLNPVDEYGPTETTVGAVYMSKEVGNHTGIGTPYFNYKVYILNAQLQPVPMGVAGELYIGGAGLSRGYLNRPELTAERFISNPFANEVDKAKGYTRLYKTGDLVRWLPNGNIDYLGRNDDQVKIRGFRIELGEIEQALLQIPGIQQTCVLARERKTDTGNSKYLVGYYVLENDEKNIAESFILETISKNLPDYMLPGALVAMASFPLTINGKLDKQAFPDPEFGALTEEFVAPATDAERTICLIWKEVLNLDKVSTEADFFIIGGDSILSIQLSSRLRQVGFPCQVKDIFEHKTISRLAEYLSKTTINTTLKTEQGMLTGELDLLPIQQWFIQKVDKGEMVNPNHFNQSFLVRVPELDIDKMKRAVIDLVAYHDALRIRYSKQQEKSSGKTGWSQAYQADVPIPELTTLNISQFAVTEIEQVLTDWQNDFNLERGHLFRVGYLHGYDDGSARLYVALHHMVVDTVSWRIITEDLRTLYEGKTLPPKGSSYRQWVEQVKHYPTQHPSEAAYWEEQLREMPGYPSTGEEEAVLYFGLDKTITTSLLQEAPKAYHTEVNDLLLTALAYALKELNHKNVQGITLEGHGREEIDLSIDHSRTVGWFTTMFPVKLELQSTMRESICLMKEAIRSIPNKGLGFGAFATAKDTTYSFEHLPPISFNYLGQFDGRQESWQITSEESGHSVSAGNTDHNLINIVGIVTDAKLEFSIATKSGKASTETLASAFKRQLIIIVEHCLQKLNEEGSTRTPSDFKDFIPYEIINEHLHEAPIFIFPPGGGGAESYYGSIVPKLKNRKLVLFNNFYAFMRERDSVYFSKETFEGLARYYKLLIQKLQPTGKYTFVGWSFGGVLAFELYRQLSVKQDEVHNLILLDSFFCFKSAESNIPENYIQEYRNDINFRYDPQCRCENLNIILFKSTQTSKSDDLDMLGIPKLIYQYVERYYVDSPYNGLDLVFGDSWNTNNNVSIIKLNCNHNDIIHTNNDIICDYILTMNKKEKSCNKTLQES